MTRLTRRRVLAAPLAALALTACGQRDKAGKQPAILLRGNGPDPDSIDPHKARASEAMVVLRDLFEGLTRLDHQAAPVPAAATSALPFLLKLQLAPSVTPRFRTCPLRPATSRENDAKTSKETSTE